MVTRRDEDQQAIQQLVGELGDERYVIERIKAEMEARGWSQIELSRRMEAEVTRSRHGGVLNQGVLSKLLRGDRGRHVSIDQLITLSKVFEIPLGELLVPDAVLANLRGWRYFMEAGELETEIRQLRNRKHDRLIDVRRTLLDAPELAERIREYRDNLIQTLQEQHRPMVERDLEHDRLLDPDLAPATEDEIREELAAYLRGVPAIVTANELLQEGEDQ